MSLIDQGNEVSIVTVCNLIGMPEVADDGGRATKYYCPFGEFYHSDPTAKAFRVYPETNSAYCFGGCGAFYPVALYAKGQGYVDGEGKPEWSKAAKELLSRTGNDAEISSSWDDLVNPKPKPVDTKALDKAFDLYVRRMLDGVPEVADTETEAAALRVYDHLRGLLKFVKTAQQADEWMAAGKTAVTQILGVTDAA